jgi:hypothetical protein
VWWWMEEVKTAPPTRFSSEGGGKGVVVGGKGQNGPLRLAFGAREGARVWWWVERSRHAVVTPLHYMKKLYNNHKCTTSNGYSFVTKIGMCSIQPLPVVHVQPRIRKEIENILVNVSVTQQT